MAGNFGRNRSDSIILRCVYFLCHVKVPSFIPCDHVLGGLLVIDCEGSDSDEKDEGLVETFARQSALFSLALAEVLIVNLWAHDIGAFDSGCVACIKYFFATSS